MASLIHTKRNYARRIKRTPYRMFDGDGLYLEITTTGNRRWRWKYRYLGYLHAVIERQLTHGERNKVSASYNFDFAEYLPERRQMMQQWADYSDKLKAGARWYRYVAAQPNFSGDTGWNKNLSRQQSAWRIDWRCW